MPLRLLPVVLAALAVSAALDLHHGLLGADRADQAPAQGRPPISRRSQRITMREVRVASPDGRLALTLAPNAERLAYAIALDGTPVIESSRIVMTLDGEDLSTGVILKNVESYAGRDTYPWSGAHDTATSEFRGARLSLTNDLTSVDYTLDVRVFDDGAAFRHVIPGDAAAPRVPDEYTTFTLPAGSTVWYAGLADGHYEANYLKKDAADVRIGEWSGPPLTFKLPNGAGYGSITEANLVSYSGMGLESDGKRGWTIGLGHRQPLNYPFELRYGREEGRRLGRAAAVAGPVTTPWRVVMAARDLDTLVNSTILPNLCPPPDPSLFPQGLKTPWIRPGRAVWRYLDGGPTGVEGMKTFSQWAGQLGFEHHVIEGFWSQWTAAERRQVVDAARQQRVSLWFWKHSNQLRTPEAREAFFTLLHENGVAGAKIDFFDHEAKEVIDLYDALLRAAAEHQIMLVFHGANKPTGRERTWPNELVREAVRGMESSALMERARHETILPFTRYLAGPADYTTMIFSERRRDTTVAHQIATMAVFASPLLTIAANPQSLLASPGVDIIKSVPAVWNETVVLPPSEIGALAVYARRTGATWFLAVLCGPEPRQIALPLSFLGSGEYQTTTVRDEGSDGSAVAVEAGRAARGDTLRLDLRAGGGLLARFNPR